MSPITVKQSPWCNSIIAPASCRVLYCGRGRGNGGRSLVPPCVTLLLRLLDVGQRRLADAGRLQDLLVGHVVEGAELVPVELGLLVRVARPRLRATLRLL